MMNAPFQVLCDCRALLHHIARSPASTKLRPMVSPDLPASDTKRHGDIVGVIPACWDQDPARRPSLVDSSIQRRLAVATAAESDDLQSIGDEDERNAPNTISAVQDPPETKAPQASHGPHGTNAIKCLLSMTATTT